MEYNPIDIFEDFELEDNKEFELPLESTSFVDLIWQTGPLLNSEVPSDILKLEIDDVPIYEPDLDQSDMCSTSVSEDYNENNSNHLSPIQIIEFNHSCNDPIKRIGALSLEERKIKVEKYKDKRQKRRWNKRINYDCRKRVADKRVRIKGRFVTKEQATILEERNKLAKDPSDNNVPSPASDN